MLPGPSKDSSKRFCANNKPKSKRKQRLSNTNSAESGFNDSDVFRDGYGGRDRLGPGGVIAGLAWSLR